MRPGDGILLLPVMASRNEAANLPNGGRDGYFIALYERPQGHIRLARSLAILLREVCQVVDVYTFATNERYVPPRRGFALRDAIMTQFGGSTRLGTSLSHLKYGEEYDRVIVITDGQSEDAVHAPKSKRGYILNVAAYQNGVGYGPWLNIDGWSDSCVKYIQAYEGME